MAEGGRGGGVESWGGQRGVLVQKGGVVRLGAAGVKERRVLAKRGYGAEGGKKKKKEATRITV